MSKKPFVLVVDDVMKNLKLIASTLLGDGYEVALASSGAEAIELLGEDVPDLILLDVMMPVMDGYQTCKKIKDNPDFVDIPIIFITAKNETEDIINGFKVGGVDYITKPFNREELLVRVRNHIELKQSKDEIQRYAKEVANVNNQLMKANWKNEKYLAVINEELDIAAEYVHSLLPKKIIGQAISTDWKFIPAATLGGDSFGYHWIDDDKLALYLLDVCGHGVGPALHSVSVLNSLRMETLPDTDFSDPVKVLETLNNTFQMKNHNDIYFTIWYGVFDTKSRKLRYASAGHPPAILINGTKNPKTLFTRNYIIGDEAKMGYTSEEIVIKKTSSLYIFSDGTYEVFLKKEMPMNIEKLAIFLKESAKENSSELDKLYEHMKDLNAGADLQDDFSILKVRFS